jgi:GH15 family glucan-1,4-alpha-glucosidase
MAQVGFIKPKDPRYIGTIAAIEQSLLVDGFVKRYNTVETDDGLEPGEGAFLACSFWLADAYVSVGRHDDAHKMLERLLSIRNDLGLLAEEYDTVNGRQIGNFPQAFSHVGLINTCFNLTRAVRPAEQRAKFKESGVQAPEAPKKPQRPGRGHEKMAEPGGHHVRRRAPSSKAR